MMARAGMMALALLAGNIAGVAAQDRIHLHTNEAEIGEALRDGVVVIDDLLAVFGAVLKNLPERVRVYPTENYFYFRFAHNGVSYVGNIRLAAADRDQGRVDWNADPKNRNAALGQEQGVTVERAAPLTYRITYAAKTVTFVLNDLSGVRPLPELMRADEKFLGPIFDESGIRFFLVFNARLKIFHFILDETAPIAEQFIVPKGGEPISIGKRTGFAFYPFEGRKILVGINERQSRLNTYFDGPFDQLPENFIEGEALREAILAADSSVKGKIDRLGNFADDSGRYLIHPYLLYRQVSDLSVFRRCATSKTVPAAGRAACFVIDDDEAQRKNPRPRALKGR
jgi:hypothetical protein